MTTELIIGIPGPWPDRTDFIRRVITEDPKGRHVYAGMVLADMEAKDNVPCEFLSADAGTQGAFEIAGQGKIPRHVLARLGEGKGVVYLHFPPDLLKHRERVLKFTKLLQSLGGIAVKLESAGIAHTWERWSELLSGSTFDLYSAAVVLVGDKDGFYSCGMHQFGLPECGVSSTIAPEQAAELMNHFNLWQLAEQPQLAPGHTFSLAAAAPRFRMSHHQDTRHDRGDLFHNPHGIWRLDAA
jgi:hypothetical protein